MSTKRENSQRDEWAPAAARSTCPACTNATDAAHALTPTATSDVADKNFCGRAVNSRQTGILMMPPPTPTSGPMQPLKAPSAPSSNVSFLISGRLELKREATRVGALLRLGPPAAAARASFGQQRKHRDSMEEPKLSAARHDPPAQRIVTMTAKQSGPLEESGRD